MRLDMTAPCHFGLEAVLKRELQDLGLTITRVEDGRVCFSGEEADVCRANIFLRTADRILIDVGDFDAKTFDELFEKTRALAWEQFIPADGRFWVKKATSVNSALHSAPSIQSIMKKAMVSRMEEAYHTDRFPETGAAYPVRVLLRKDHVNVYLDTSGEPLHKRGYRTEAGAAPISETLAAALILLTPWKADRILVDPFCGSGTFLIEAAMMAAHIAPGARRRFEAENWPGLIPAGLWQQIRQEARDAETLPVDTDLQGYDIDKQVLATARHNAKTAGVEGLIHFQERAVSDLAHPKKYGFIVTNPPYGERMGSELPQLYADFGAAVKRLDEWSIYMITAYKDAEKYFGRKADKKRKIYNGMLRTDYLQFFGARPPRKRQERPS